jgi:hypothetical protein
MAAPAVTEPPPAPVGAASEPAPDAAPEPEADNQPRRTGWWAKRLLGKG